MLDLPETIYCHQQICIPPTFPYLLRQYAKAAIRTQPADLLRWSTAYFRALARGVEPPSKPRLEYPIPPSFRGLTPGWLKALLRQMAGRCYAPWPLLVDRWIGACLDLEGLVRIVVLAGFTDPRRLPWLKVVAVAAGHLTQNLTDTMILICELLTDEPEGGSASIVAAVFCDLYAFLAGLDASRDITVHNLVYTESAASMRSDRAEPEGGGDSARTSLAGVSMATPAASARRRAREMVGVVYELELGEEEEEVVAVEGVPEVAGGEQELELRDLGRYLDMVGEMEGEAEEQGQAENIVSVSTLIPSSQQREEKVPKSPSETSCMIDLDGEQKEHGSSKSESTSESTESLVKEVSIESVEKSVAEEELPPIEEETTIKEEQETTTKSSSIELYNQFTEIHLTPVPGIGPIVPPEMVQTVIKYVNETSLKQQGMIMPRNIKHFLCPPLEQIEY